MEKKLNQIFVESISLFKNTWWSNVKIFFVPMVFWVIIDLFWSCSTALGRVVFDRSVTVFDFLDLALHLIIIEFFIFSVLAVVDYLVKYHKGVHVEIKYSLGKALSILLPFFGMIIVLVFKTFLWSLLFVIPGVIAFIFYGASLFCFVADDKRGGQAVKMSAVLIKPNIVWYLDCLLFIVFVLVSCAVAWVKLWDVVLLHYLHLNNQFLAYMINYIELLGVFGASLLFLCFYTVLYEELKKRNVLKAKDLNSSES